MRQYYRAEEYETPVLQCPDCGSWVWDETAHDQFHARVEPKPTEEGQ